MRAARSRHCCARARRCATAGARRNGRPARSLAAMDEQRLYDSLFPYYAEVCTVTQLARRGERPGGWGGHATMFLGGVELVPGAGHPRLPLAEPGAAGVGVSVNRGFRNANWVAVAGREAFFDGWLAPEAMLDDRAYDDAVARAMGAGWFAGVALREAG